MLKHIKIALILTATLSSFCLGDIFKHRISGETFKGYVTQTSKGNKTKVYEQNGEKFNSKTINISEYEIKYSPLGRKNKVIVLPLNHSALLRSETVSKMLSKTIVYASNSGPRYIILEIDLPGGQAENMKIIADTIKSTKNCPIIAFITGEKYSGAYSVAAGLALACDKIFISPKASIGTFAPLDEDSKGLTETQFHEIFSPLSNALESKYLAKMCEGNPRPEAIAEAFVNPQIEVVEVITDQIGSRNIIDKENKKPGDSIAKKWSQEYKPIISDLSDSKDDIQLMQITLSADDAIYTRIADSIAASRADVLKELNASDAKVSVTNKLRRPLLVFQNNLNAMGNLLGLIERLETQAEKIEKDYEKVATASLNNLSDMENERAQRIQRQIYQNQLKNKRRWQGGSNRRVLTPQEIEEIEQDLQRSYVNPYVAQQEQIITQYVFVLDDLSYAYSKVLTIAKQYPGALPQDKSLLELSQRLNQIIAKLNQITFYRQTQQSN